MKWWRVVLWGLGGFLCVTVPELLINSSLRLVPVVGRDLYGLASSLELLLLVRYFLVGNFFYGRSADTQHAPGSGARWRASVSAVVLFFVSPFVLATIGTSGGSERAAITAFQNELSGESNVIAVETVFLFIVLLIVVAVPQVMHRLERPYKPDSRLPGWLAGLAAVMTAAYIISLYFDRSVLPSPNLGVVSFAAFGAALLLAPFYKAVARAEWQFGTETVFDPAQWWQSWCGAWQDITGSSVDGITVEQVAETGAVGTSFDPTDP